MRPVSRLNQIPEVPIHTVQVVSQSYVGDGPLLDFSQGVLGATPAEAVLDAVGAAAHRGAGKAYVPVGDPGRGAPDLAGVPHAIQCAAEQGRGAVKITVRIAP